MVKTKLNDYLQTMTVYELNRFAKYIQSPLYNKDKKILEFALQSIKWAKKNKMRSKSIKNSVTMSNLSFAEGISRTKYNRLLSDTVKKVEHFLVLDRFRQQAALQNNYLLSILNERGLSKHFPELATHTKKQLAKYPYRDAEYCYLEYLLQQQTNIFLENKAERNVNKNLQQILLSLDTFYFISKLKYSAILLHYGVFLNVEADLNLFREVLNETAHSKFDSNPALHLYRNIVLLYDAQQADGAYQKLKELLLQAQLPLQEMEIKMAFTFVINYCITQINIGQQSYLNELLTLYKHALQTGLLLDDGVLSHWEYKNICTTALRAKEYKWAKMFLENYKLKLRKIERNNAYTFNLARYYFYTKKYDEVLRLLQQVEYTDIFYQLDAKTTLLKTYYEIGEWQPLNSLKDSFRILLSRKKQITPGQKENYMNLIRFTLRLFNCDVKNKKQLMDLKRDIISAQNVADKSWVLEKINELL